MPTKAPFEFLPATEARQRLEVFSDAVSNGGITTMADYELVMGRDESSLQHSIGSLVFHHGEPGVHFPDSYRLKQRQDGWNLHADVQTKASKRYTSDGYIAISSHRRRFGIWREQDLLLLQNNDPWEVMNIEKRIGVDDSHIMSTYNPDLMKYIDEMDDDIKHQRFHSTDQNGTVRSTVSSAEMLATARADAPDVLASFLRTGQRVVGRLLAATDRPTA